MHEAKTELSRLVERALAGEDIVIARAGVPVVRLVPVQRFTQRKLGQWKGRVKLTDDFNEPLPPATDDVALSKAASRAARRLQLDD